MNSQQKQSSLLPRSRVASPAARPNPAGLQLGPLANDEPRSRQYRRYIVRPSARGFDHFGGASSGGGPYAAQHQLASQLKAQAIPGLENLEALYAELCKLRLLSQARKTDIEIMERNLREVATSLQTKSPQAVHQPPPLPPRSPMAASSSARTQLDSASRSGHIPKNKQQNGHKQLHSQYVQGSQNHVDNKRRSPLSGHDLQAPVKLENAESTPRCAGPEKLVLKLKRDPNHKAGKRSRSPERVTDVTLQAVDLSQSFESVSASPPTKRKRISESDDAYSPPPAERLRGSPSAERRSSSQSELLMAQDSAVGQVQSSQNSKKRKGLPALETQKKKAKAVTPPPLHAQRVPSVPASSFPAAGSSPGGAVAGARTVDTGSVALDTVVAQEIPKVKAGSQVPIHTFYTSVEPYFRLLTEDDIRWLEFTEEEDSSLYQIPKPGTSIPDGLTAFDNTLGSPFRSLTAVSTGRTENGTRRKSSVSFAGIDPKTSDINAPGASATEFAGPVTARLLCSLLPEPVKDEEQPLRPTSAHRVTIKLEPDVEDHESIIEDERDLFGSAKEQQAARDSSLVFEKRIMEELRFIGLLDDEPIDWKAREDNEVAATLRKLQEELKEQIRVNRERRECVAQVAKEHMGYQEYLSVLEELDGKVESTFAKRYRPMKGAGKKKKVPQNTAYSSDHAVTAAERRRKLITHVGAIFQPFERFSLPERSIFGEPPPPSAQ